MSHDDLINADTARRFLELLHARAAAALSHCARPGMLQLVSIAPDDKGMSVSPFSIGDVDRMVEAALTDACAGRNVFIEARTVRPGRPCERGRGKLESTIGLFALVIDRDADTGKAGHANGADATIVETSPGNSQEWLWLCRALDAGDGKPLGERVRKATGADHATGVVTQPYRVPGLPNYPNAKKRARGRVVVPTRLIRVSDKVWTPAEIEAAFSTGGTQTIETQPARKATRSFKLRTPRKIAAVKKRLVKKTDDRSAQFQSAVNAAARVGMPPDQFEKLAREHSDGCASKYLENGDRLKAEVERSYAKTEMPSAPAISAARKEPVKPNVLPDQDHVGNGHDHVEPDGSELLDRVYEFLGRFVCYPSTEAHAAHTLWIAHTHLMDCWDTTPRLAFLSPELGSGKTRALEVSELLVPRPVPTLNASPAYIVRKVGAEEGLPTILFDEIDAVFGPKAGEGSEDLRALLNAGYRRGATVGRCVAHGSLIVPEDLPAFCAVALASLGGLPDTIASRSIVVRMRRRAPNERIIPFRRRRYEAEGWALRERLGAWAAAAADRITEPEMPPEITDRDADCWEPLIATADAAGGHWSDAVRCYAVTLVMLLRGDGEERESIRLLSDMRAVFGSDEQTATNVILDRLHKVDESPWADIRGKPLNDRGLAVRLRPYGIKPRVIRLGSTTSRGYRREDFEDTWARYLPPPVPPKTA